MTRYATGIIALLLAACGPGRQGREKPAPDLLVSVRDAKVEAPDSIGPGWTRIKVDEDGAGHILVLFKVAGVPKGESDAAFLTALDTSAVTPSEGAAMGGPEIGDTGEVVVLLTPGRYLLGCVRRGEDGHRHLATGESKILVVTPQGATAGRNSPPGAAQEVAMVDFAYVTPEVWQSGPHMLRVVNRGSQDHQLRLARLRPGVSVHDWAIAEDPGAVVDDIAGVARTGPGSVTYLPLDLAAGNYVMYCLVTDPGSHAQHVVMGMFKGIEVKDD